MRRAIQKAKLFTGYLLAFLCPLGSFAQGVEAAKYKQVDADIAAFSAETGHHDSLVKFVRQRFGSDELRVRAFYTWIALNISYDKSLLDQYRVTSALQLRNYRPGGHSQDADTVLAQKKAVCEGFCNLMNYFCRQLNIPSYMVAGITRLPEGEVVENILHTWNAVKVDSAWRLLDITWSGGYVNSKDEYVKKFSGWYFFTPPSEFVSTHWPLDAMWQLLDRPLTKAEFYKEQPPPGALTLDYRDSINAYLNMRESEREYVDLLHYYRYDPENRMYTEGIDHYVYNKAATSFNKAALYFEDYSEYAKKLKGKEVGMAEVKKCIRLLNEPRRHLEDGLRFAKGQRFFHETVKRKFDDMVQSSSKRLVEINGFLDSYRKMQAALR